MESMAVKDKFLFRAKCLSKDTNNIECNWYYGALGWYEVQPGPSDKKMDIEQYNRYYILARSPDAFADWHLPYPQTKFFIPQKYISTIGKYLGIKDKNREKIFDGDILHQVIEGTSYVNEFIVKNGILFEYFYNNDKIIDYLVHPFFTFPMEKNDSFTYTYFTSLQIAGNIFDGNRDGFKITYPLIKIE